MEQREEFVHEALKHRKTFRHLCSDYGINPKTGYKWMDRFYEYG
ncbi:MAG: helix-turn-helix domain-containing protein [Candidatus Marinimicrobia bacterium]|nr:helix-turn-helix domain-containing protein [Candidatus Neomarinimicrobiota bacterium]